MHSALRNWPFGPVNSESVLFWICYNQPGPVKCCDTNCSEHTFEANQIRWIFIEKPRLLTNFKLLQKYLKLKSWKAMNKNEHECTHLSRCAAMRLNWFTASLTLIADWAICCLPNFELFAASLAMIWLLPCLLIQLFRSSAIFCA